MATRFLATAVCGTPSFKVNTKADGHIAKTGDTVMGNVTIKLSKFAIGSADVRQGTNDEWELVNNFGNTIFGILCAGGSFDEYATVMYTARPVVEVD